MGGGLVVTRPAPMLQHIDMGMLVLVLVLLLLRRGTLLPSWLPRSEAIKASRPQHIRALAEDSEGQRGRCPPGFLIFSYDHLILLANLLYQSNTAPS